MGYFVLFLSLFAFFIYYCIVWNLRIGNMSRRRKGRRTSATHRHHENRRKMFIKYSEESKQKQKQMNLITLYTCTNAKININPAYVINCFQRFGTGRVVLILSNGDHFVLAEHEKYRNVVTRIMNANNLPF